MLDAEGEILARSTLCDSEMNSLEAWSFDDLTRLQDQKLMHPMELGG